MGFQERVLRECSEQGLHLIVESRTEQLTEEKLAWATSVNDDFTVAIGLEAYDDEVLRFHVNKGFTVRSYDRAVANLKQFQQVLAPPAQGVTVKRRVWVELAHWVAAVVRLPTSLPGIRVPQVLRDGRAVAVQFMLPS